MAYLLSDSTSRPQSSMVHLLSLPRDETSLILAFAGPTQFLPYALVGFRKEYQAMFGTTTNIKKIFSNISVARFLFQELRGTKSGKKLFKSACELCAYHGNIELLNWLIRSSPPGYEYPCQLTREVLEVAASQGHLRFAKYARDHGCPWDANVCRDSALNDHLEVLQWARANGCPWDKWVCAEAALNGHLEVLQWARANGCPWDKWVCTEAARNGHFEVLQWARANGCPWDKWVCTEAARNGHFEFLQWARANGCP